MRWIVLCVVLGVVTSAFAQAPPTATEAFNLRIKCKEMVDRKEKDLQDEYVTAMRSSSRYDPRSNRCFGEFQYYTPGLYKETRLLVDMQIDEVIAHWGIVDKKHKFGTVYRKLQKPLLTNKGWDDADAYISKMMAETD
jgi:hypothetical protein